MVIWKVLGNSGNALEFTLNGYTDYGSVKVVAFRKSGLSDWSLECRVPGWEHREPLVKQNIRAYAEMNGVLIDANGSALLSVAKSGADNDQEHQFQLGRTASFLTATVMSAAFIRKTMGASRDEAERAA